MSFSNKWIKPQNEISNVGMKLLENIKPPSPLKPRIEEAQKRLHSQIAKLESMSAKMDEKIKSYLRELLVQCRIMIVNMLKSYLTNYHKSGK